MYRNSAHQGLLTIMYSGHTKPLQLWDKRIRNGHIKRVKDTDIQNPVIEILGTKVAQTYITAPVDVKKSLGIRYPILNMTVKNMNKFFAFEVQISDDKNCRRRFHASTFITASEVRPFVCKIPMNLEDGWNQIQVNLQELVKRAYGTNYKETIRLQIHSNCRVRRIFFSDKAVSEEELPPDYKLYIPTHYHSRRN